MGVMNVENNRVLYKDEDRVEVLLDCNDLIHNYSRFPLQYLGNNDKSLLGMLLGDTRQHAQLAAGTNEMYAGREYATIECFLAKEHMKTPYELNVLEIGCTSGIMSYYLAKVLTKYNENSRLCCVTNVMGNDSSSGWLDKIAVLENLPKLSFLATDYDDIPLPDNCYDIVVINGSESFEEKEAVLTEAVRVLKKGGVLLVYVVGDAELIELVAQRSDRLDAYMYLEDRCLIRVKQEEILSNHSVERLSLYRVEEVTAWCDKLLESEADEEQLRDAIQKIDEYIKKASEECNLDAKVVFSQYKGEILDKLVNLKYAK